MFPEGTSQLGDVAFRPSIIQGLSRCAFDGFGLFSLAGDIERLRTSDVTGKIPDCCVFKGLPQIELDTVGLPGNIARF